MLKSQSTLEIPTTHSRIGKKSVYSGTLRFKNSMGILGTVKGTIQGGELLVVYPGAKIEGDILVDYALIMGAVYGDINAQKGVYFYESSVVRGGVLSAIIRMQTGVDFEGKCNLIGQEDINIFSVSRDSFRNTLFDQCIHELDAIAHQRHKSS